MKKLIKWYHTKPVEVLRSKRIGDWTIMIVESNHEKGKVRLAIEPKRGITSPKGISVCCADMKSLSFAISKYNKIKTIKDIYRFIES